MYYVHTTGIVSQDDIVFTGPVENTILNDFVHFFHSLATDSILEVTHEHGAQHSKEQC